LGKKYTDEQKQQILELSRQGLTRKEVCEKVGINNLTTVRNICKEDGLPDRMFYPAKKAIYAIGQRYNNYVIIAEASCRITKTGKKFIVWRCLCNCGKVFEITSKQIHRGQKSCGCLSITSRFHKHDTRLVIGRHKFAHYKYKASERELSFELTEKQFIDLLFGNCYYCGSEPFTIIKMKKHISTVNGVDRVDNNEGYSLKNCVTCCKICNRAKSDACLQEFLDWIDRLRNNI
jgi:hypothetical protein